jgi:hypothetical protein
MEATLVFDEFCQMARFSYVKKRSNASSPRESLKRVARDRRGHYPPRATSRASLASSRARRLRRSVRARRRPPRAPRGSRGTPRLKSRKLPCFSRGASLTRACATLRRAPSRPPCSTGAGTPPRQTPRAPRGGARSRRCRRAAPRPRGGRHTRAMPPTPRPPRLSPRATLARRGDRARHARRERDAQLASGRADADARARVRVGDVGEARAVVARERRPPRHRARRGRRRFETR